MNALRYALRAKQTASGGFTLIELLIYTTLTAVVVSIFVGILITVTNVQTRQSSSSSLTTEIGFLMSNMRRLVHQAVDISIPDAETLTLTMSISPSITNTITFNADDNRIELTEVGPSGTVNSILSTTNLQINDLTFTDRSAGLSKSVGISLTATVFPDNPVRKLSRTLDSTAALYLQEQ